MEIKWIHDSEGGMRLHRHRDCLWLSFPDFDKESWLINGFSTRFGGVSRGHLAAMNLGFRLGDDPENVQENFSRIASAIGFPKEQLVLTQQTHTTNIRRVTWRDRGRGITKPLGWTDVDGLVTDDPGVVLAAFFADCVPLYFIDPVHQAIGLAHSGWRGTAAKMGLRMVETMQKEFGTDPEDIHAAIGPSICQDCYEVSSDVAHQFPTCYFVPGKEGKYQLDLQDANRGILAEAGIPIGNISMSDLCTCCNPDLLHSHRATGGKRGLLGAFLGIRGPEV